MTPQDLKDLRKKATDGFAEFGSASVAMQDYRKAADDLMPDLIALWEACSARITSWGGLETRMLDMPSIEQAVNKLNLKAKSVH